MSAARFHSVDLFAGAGGLALGTERAGFDALVAVEKDEAAARTWRRNLSHGGRALVLGDEEPGDVVNLDFGRVAAHLSAHGVERLDLLHGGPPCQGFSRIGRGKLNHLGAGLRTAAEDQRNSLVWDFLRGVRVLRPRAVLIENVPGMLSLEGVNHAEQVALALERLGYNVRLSVLNASWYGVPQHRDRLFIMALSREIPAPQRWFPQPLHGGRAFQHLVGSVELRTARFEHSRLVEEVLPADEAAPPVSVAEALGDLPPFTAHLDTPRYSSQRGAHPSLDYTMPPHSDYARLMRAWSDGHQASKVSDHYCRHTPRDFPIFARMAPGDRYPEAVTIALELFQEALRRKPTTQPEDHVPPYPVDRGFEDRWKKLRPDEPSHTVTAHLAHDCYSHIHPDSTQARTITPREAARLQSFPDAFVFEGNTGQCYRQIGNAVPPLLGYHLALKLREHLERERHQPAIHVELHEPPTHPWTGP